MLGPERRKSMASSSPAVRKTGELFPYGVPAPPVGPAAAAAGAPAAGTPPSPDPAEKRGGAGKRLLPEIPSTVLPATSRRAAS